MNTSMLFEGPDLELVLAEAQRCLGDSMQIDNASRVRRGGFLGFFAKEWFEVWASPPTAKKTKSKTPRVPVAAAAETSDFESAFSRAIGDATVSSKHDAAIDDFFGSDGSQHENPSPRPAPSGQAVGSLDTLTRPATTRPQQRAVETIRKPTSAAVALDDPKRGKSVFSNDEGESQGLLWDMLVKLDQLPEAPPMPVGDGLVAFVGDPNTARLLAGKIGSNLGIWRGDATVLSQRSDLPGYPSWLVVNSIEEARQRLERWRSRDSVTPIVIDQPIDAGDREWTAEVLDMLEVDHTRLVTEAWRLPSDVDHLIRRIGPIDALDLVEVKGTLEPLSMVDLDIPIATIEGRPASAELLAAVWLERRRHG